MKRLMAMVAVGVCAAVGAKAQEMTYGQVEFMNSCAVCHGQSGRGDGPMADELQKRPADLTRLAERNGGEFPSLNVYSTIDGRYVIAAHGTRDMPIWGRAFREEDRETYGPDEGEAVSSLRVEQLTRYIETLQR
ncbi:MAG: c-type cytochrome [Rhizobiaceae bacterium]|nr:c-type cytochrome [Rhizobiaceae bacterium]